MLRSLFSGVSGLRNHQVKMDVIGNNIANVNTVAFKEGRVTFKEGFAQLLQGASRPPGDQGGINPIQVGLGMQIGSVDTLFSQGNIETTGINTDLAIQGESFFVVSKGNQHFYTRSGNFQLDADGKLVSPTNGFVVQGKMAVNGVFADGIQDIKLPFGQKTAAKATTSMRIAGNVNASAAVFASTRIDSTVVPQTSPATMLAADPLDPSDRASAANAESYTESSLSVFDSVGEKHDVKVVLYKMNNTAAGDAQWGWKIDPAELAKTGASLVAGTDTGVVTFDANGTIKTPTSMPTVSFTAPGANQVNVTMDFGSGANGLSQYSSTSTAVLRDQDGYTAGTLQSFSIDRTGTITGAFTNGTTEPLGQIVLADFNNPSGLLRTGDNMYGVSGNSGGAVLGYALEGSQSSMTSGALEMSNVDLAQEFTNMIVAQRGFQANSKVITTSDEMLQELMTLKR